MSSLFLEEVGMQISSVQEQQPKHRFGMDKKNPKMFICDCEGREHWAFNSLEKA